MGHYEVGWGIQIHFSKRSFYTLMGKNHHPETKSTYPKFFARLFFYPAGPISDYTLANCLIRANSSGACATVDTGAVCGANAVCTLFTMFTPLANFPTVPPAAWAA